MGEPVICDACIRQLATRETLSLEMGKHKGGNATVACVGCATNVRFLLNACLLNCVAMHINSLISRTSFIVENKRTPVLLWCPCLCRVFLQHNLAV